MPVNNPFGIIGVFLTVIPGILLGKNFIKIFIKFKT